jgi:hypothetical protein
MTMTPKHTPGPWTAEACFRYDRSTQSRVPDGFEIHGPEHQGVAGIVENEADAPLLAAAPEMLELLETIENDTGMVPEWLWDRIKNVCRKARGGQ